MIRILIVEDEQAISNLIKINLKKAGYHCECAYDGMAAADMLEKDRYDLVLLDVMLPKADGFELMSYISPMEIPVIFLTAKSAVADRVKGLKLGADDYLTKPFEIIELLAEVENNYYVDKRIVSHLQQMLSDGRKAGLDFWICSAYRSMEKQTQLFENKVQRVMAEKGLSYEEAYKEAGTEVAYPGTSEHQLGLAVDIVAKDYQILDEKQANTDEAKWLEENCWKYGFILRYPLDKTEQTGIIFEPWHYRYVGIEAAKEIMEQGICLEEYLEAN